MPRRHSVKRITGWSLFLGAALFLALSLYYLPELLLLDRLRPQFIELLESTFHCRAEIGHVRGQIIPTPGLFVSRMVLIDPADRARIFASGGVRLELSGKVLLSGRIQFKTLRFMRPRFIAHRIIDRNGAVRWVQLSFPQTARPARPSSIETIEVRAGRLELWDHRTQPMTRWMTEQLSGSFQTKTQEGAFSAIAPLAGRRTRLDIGYKAAREFPIEIRVREFSLQAIQTILNPSSRALLTGRCDAMIRARYQPAWQVHAALSPIQIDKLPGVRLTSTIDWDGRKLHGEIKTLTTRPMSVTLDGEFPQRGWSIGATVKNYDAAIMRKLYDQTWLNRLAGFGTISFRSHSDSNGWQWSAGGRGFHLDESVFDIPDWSAQGNPQKMIIYVRAATASGGAGEVVWERPAESADANLTVSVASVTVHNLLQIFKLEAKPRTVPAGGYNPYAYEQWKVARADLQGVIRSTGALEVQDSDIDLAGMHMDLAGTFGLKGAGSPAHVVGDIYYVALADRISDFTRKGSPLTGVANADFDLNFPLNANWLHGFSGWIQLNAVNGVLRELKTFYRVMSVLNLTNYLKFHMPQVGAEGVTFQSLTGRIWFKNGLATTDNLFVRSPNMNIGIQGAADLLMKRVDLILRMELIRFLEDVLKHLPITNRIFKKSNKIFLPIVVRVKGPWDNPDVF